MAEGNWWKNKMTWVIVLAVSALILVITGYFGYRGYRTYAFLKATVEQQKQQIADYQEEITVNAATIAKSEKNRQYLAGQIAKKIAESKNLKEPKDVEEIKQRLLQLGFHPIAGKR